MSFSMQKFPDEPIILIDCHSNFDPASEMVAYSEQLMALLDAQPEPTFCITALPATKYDFNAFASAANVSRSYAMKNLREPILVTDSEPIRMAMKGLDSDIFHHLKIRVFPCLDEALAYVREQVGAA